MKQIKLKKGVIFSDHAVEVQSFLRRNESALELGERVAAAYEKLLPPIHPSLGMYLMRVSFSVALVKYFVRFILVLCF